MLFSSSKLHVKKDIRILQSDNNSAYFTLSDFNNDYDGLWSDGYNLFKSVFIDKTNNTVDKKIHSFYDSLVKYAKKFNLNFCLFKNDNGFLIEIINKSLNLIQAKSYTLFFKIENNFSIIEKNINNVVLEYDEKSEEYGYNKYYCSFAINKDHIIENVLRENNFLKFIIKAHDNANKNCHLYLYYNSNYDILKKKIDLNINRIDELKEIQIIEVDKTLKEINISINDHDFNKALNWSVFSSESFIINKNNFTGIWAGYPWFNNFWGRDTFISLAGICLVTGRFNEAKEILINFSKYQNIDKSSHDDGKIPNIIYNSKKAAYNSADVTPLFIRSVYEYLLYTNDYETILLLWDKIQYAVDNAYLNKKDKNNLIKHNDSEDWMDSKKDGAVSYSPRGKYAVEIQTLWYTALYAAGNLAKYIYKYKKTKEYINISQKYTEEALKLNESFNKFFVCGQKPYLIDHLENGYKKSEDIRVNPILAIYFTKMPGIPELLNLNKYSLYLNYIFPELVYLHGVGALSQNSDYFHPVHINEMYNKDAAYHNGLIWLWLSGPLTSLMCSINMHDYIFQQTKNISEQILTLSTAGSLSELLDVYYPSYKDLKISGAYSQAWSIAEFNRAFFQDYLGIKLNIINREILLSPKLPSKIESLKTNILFGNNEKVSYAVKNDNNYKNISYIEIKAINLKKPVFIKISVFQGKINKYDAVEDKLINIKIKMTDKDDHFIINFNQSETKKLLIIKNIKLSNNSEIISIKSINTFTNSINNNDFHYSEPLNKDDLKKIKTLSIKNYLESDLKH